MNPETQKLHRLFEDEWEELLKEFPEMATYAGRPGSNDRWTDHSFTAIERRRKHAHRTQARLGAIERKALEPADQLDYDLYLRRVREEIEGQKYRDEYMPVTQLQGVQQDVGRILSMNPAFTTKDHEDIVARLEKIPALLEEMTALMRRGIETGITVPKITMADVPRQIEAQLTKDPARSEFISAFSRMPESIPARKRESLRKAAAAAVGRKVHPALRKFQQFIEKTYTPACRKTLGMSELPDGREWYAFKARSYTTTAKKPEELHELGRQEVARVRGEIQAVMKRIGFKGDFAKLGKFMRSDKRFFHTKPEALLAEYRDVCKRLDPALMKLFGKLPRLPYGVIAVPEHAAKSAPTAFYQPGSLEGGRPGWYFANTHNLKARPRWEIEPLTLHEAVPGHHLQIALSRELTGVPEFRKHDMHIAYVEGWALYAESLGEELGLYTDPYSKLGQLSYEVWRSARLVVDTGLHYLNWSRKQAIEYLEGNTCKPRHDVVIEVDRYIALPGQALAYKVGELAIQALRRKATKALGDRLDIRAFHDALLGDGSLPLDILQERMEHWIEKQ